MRVLFIGNSHTYFNDMPHTFANMVQSLTGEKPEVTMLAYSNKDLAWHREEYFAVRFAILYGNYDFCVLQQQAHPFPEEETTFENAKRIFRLCETAGTKPVVYMTWAMRGESEVTKQMSDCYRRLAEECGALLAPVGERFKMVQQKHPEIDLFWHDNAHASAYGDYLIAAVFAALLTGKTDLSALPDDGVDFRADFEGENGLPLALESVEAARIRLDPEKTAILRDYAV